MSVCVLVKVPEGVVLAADSASTVEGGVVRPDGEHAPAGVLKVYFNANKVHTVGNLPLGILTWGAGAFKARTLPSLVEEFENLQEIRDLTPSDLEVDKIAGLLWEFLLKKSDEMFDEIPAKARPRSGLIVAGYSKKDFFPEEYKFVTPVEPPSRMRPPQAAGPDFGANWFGMTDAIVRLHFGRDDALFSVLNDEGVADEVIEKVKKKLQDRFQYFVPFSAMPLGDAVEYARYLIQVAIGRFRFAVGAELCGGPIDVATITRRDGFKWVHKKNWELSARGERHE